MYILIDRENLKIAHKHFLPGVLCNLAWMELQTVFHVIGPCDSCVLNGFTEMELKMLYRNATGNELHATGRKEVIAAVVQFLQTFPVSDVDEEELEFQAAAVSEGTKGSFKYVKGAKRPAKPQSLFSGERPAKTERAERHNDGVGKETSKTVIWRVADELWEAAGKCSVKEEVLKLRKLIMDKLEQQFSIKRTSASSELANWHKTRAPY